MKPLDPNRKIYVYRNIRRNCLSLMQDKIIVGHAEAVILNAVEFRVRESGRQRVLQERQKNVHAFSIGLLEHYYGSFWPVEVDKVFDRWSATRVTYNPYKFGYFYSVASEAPVYWGGRVLVTASHGVYVEVGSERNN